MDLLYVELLSPINLKIILKEYFKIKLEIKDLIIMYSSMDGVNKMELNSGMVEIHGDLIGVSMETLKSLEVSIIWVYKIYVIGEDHLIHGLMI